MYKLMSDGKDRDDIKIMAIIDYKQFDYSAWYNWQIWIGDVEYVSYDSIYPKAD